MRNRMGGGLATHVRPAPRTWQAIPWFLSATLWNSDAWLSLGIRRQREGKRRSKGHSLSKRRANWRVVGLCVNPCPSNA
jgi:hypothetical protein